jgi:GAF domain-containing protein
MTDYKLIIETMKGIVANCNYPISVMANGAAILYNELSDLNWAGFYLMEDGKLILGPFQGKLACMEIQVGKGVCGTAVAERKVQRVANVHEFPGHIACDSASNSEIVIPIYKDGEVFGVLDIDSPEFNRFSEEDEKNLTEFVRVLETGI